MNVLFYFFFFIKERGSRTSRPSKIKLYILIIYFSSVLPANNWVINLQIECTFFILFLAAWKNWRYGKAWTGHDQFVKNIINSKNFWPFLSNRFHEKWATSTSKCAFIQLEKCFSILINDLINYYCFIISSSYLLIKNGTKGEKGEPGQIVNVVINFLLDLYVLVPNVLQIFLKNPYFIFDFCCWYL